MNDPFWFKNYTVLFEKNKTMQFWPTKYQTYEERINSLTRFILYAGGILSFYKRQTNPMVFSILLIVVLVVISNSKNKVLNKILIKDDDCQHPSIQNPVANQLPYDNVLRKKACNSLDVSNGITEALFAQFPTKGLGDKNKEFVERQFFSLPNTDLVNDQKGFASWLYGSPNRKMCKSDPSACTGFEGNINS